MATWPPHGAAERPTHHGKGAFVLRDAAGEDNRVEEGGQSGHHHTEKQEIVHGRAARIAPNGIASKGQKVSASSRITGA
jgi:hypothetical protein